MIERRINVSLSAQKLELFDDNHLLGSYLISTSKYGEGELANSFKTPRGRHIIRAKIGAGVEKGTVFEGRRATGEVFSEQLALNDPDRDWVLTRILWLSGTEVGRNRLGSVDTMRRFVYIHGTPYVNRLGNPGSLGCIRMSCADITELYELVSVGTTVEIIS
ncbi:MAG: L,D-transpeptidase [Rhodospirillaceae bacterium]|nr:L,D-transpeptidase [Rhodospirillaceae bacterium]